MENLIKTAKEIDRLLTKGIEIHPNSPIHERLKQALNMPAVVGRSEQLNAFMDFCNKIEPVWAEEFRDWIDEYIEGV